MTFLERLKELHPDMDTRDVYRKYCPFMYRLEPPGRGLCHTKHMNACSECWNREMPDMEGIDKIIRTLSYSVSDHLTVTHVDGNTSIEIRKLVAFLEDYKSMLGKL